MLAPQEARAHKGTPPPHALWRVAVVVVLTMLAIVIQVPDALLPWMPTAEQAPA
jgi:hypothetical protein